jgi:AraC family transcriptional regulator of adaptative response/methylated-DNA-[protein]-cysteine methyltransferase
MRRSRRKQARRPRPAQAEAGPHVEAIHALCRYIETHLEEQLTLEVLAGQAHLSPYHLQRTFKRITGITPRQYADACRLGRLKERLRESNNVTTALYEAGYGSSSRLYERSAAQLGMTPGDYRKGAPAAAIRYTIAGCPLGLLLLAGTERGICAVYLGDTEESLEVVLGKEFPRATRQRDDEGLRPWVVPILEHLEGHRPHLDLPLDVQATAFQWRVWEELRKIPSGSTRTYGEVAGALGQPSAARAVARACATNPVSVLIPCHRVIREDGGLGGYRWGLSRKQALLEHEKDNAPPSPKAGSQ